MQKYLNKSFLNISLAAVTAAALFTVPQRVTATETGTVSIHDEIVYEEIEVGSVTRIDLSDVAEGEEYTIVCEDERISLSELQYDEENDTYYIEAELLEETDEDITVTLRSEEEMLEIVLQPAEEEQVDLPAETALDEYVTSEEKLAASGAPVSVNIMYGTAYADGEVITSADIGTELVLEAEEDTEDRKFIRWSDGNTDRIREYTLTDALTLEAVFAERHMISVKDAEASEEKAFAGAEITVTAKERTGYTFDSWAVDEDTEYAEDGMMIRFLMPDHDVSVQAVYTLLDGTWSKKDGKWTFRFTDGKVPVSEWALIKGEYYLFDSEGMMLTGWQKYDGKWYYMHASGARASGWEKLSGKWYFLDRKDGAMRTGWVADNNKWYYMDASGAMTTGWQKIKNNWYYMKSSGVMVTGWLQQNNKWYYMDASGVMITGWRKVSGKWYYMSSSGAMQTGWQKISDKWYYMDKNGAMVTGWRKISGKWYYMDASGAMATGWKKISGKWYLLNSSGAMLTGWQENGGKWYYLNKAGDMVTGWKRIKGEYYYMNSSGEMLTGTQSINGKTYQFKTNGALKTGSFSELKILFVDTAIKPQWKNLYKLFGNLGAKTYFLDTADFNVDDYDGLVLGGGGDVDPSFYGESNQGSRNIDIKEDKLQLAAIKKFVEAGKPVFGVCRGAQVLNVYFGGSLHQDKSGHMGVYRGVTTAEGSFMEGTVSNGYSAYHSHHQCVKDLGSGLWATSYDSKDGLIEGFEHKSLPVFGVQYHPEAMGNCNSILTVFLKEVRANKLGIRSGSQ